MRVAALQLQPAGPQANLARIGQAARAAAGFGADLLVTPEMGLTGYAIWEDIPRLAEPRDGKMVASIAELARSHGIAIVAGFPERDGETIYNSAVLAQPDGALTIYRKCHLYGPLEKAAFTASDRLPAITAIAGIKAALLICYDVEFPEMVRAATLAGAELVLVPTALPRGAAGERVSQSMIQTRAYENHVFIIYADLCGEENDTPYHGGSVIAAPDGQVLARAGDEEALLMTALDPARYASAELDPYLQDRRPEIYASK
jgi:predicted amidohydrolase